MSSAARQSFMTGLEALRSACDEPAVRAATSTGDFFRRGLTVAAFNLLETFLDDRWHELAAHVNTGHIQFQDLPDRMQRRAIMQTFAVARSKLQRGSWELTDLRDFSRGVGSSLATVDRGMAISPFTWMWQGSNIAADDFAAGLRHIHVARPYLELLALSSRLGFASHDSNGDPINLKDDLASLAAERHMCAHVATYGVTPIWLRAVPERILRFAVGFDIFASLAADRLRVGDPKFLSDEAYFSAPLVTLRFVQERARDWAESHEGGRRALHVASDGGALFNGACARAAGNEAVVRQLRTGELIDWSIPAVG